MNLPSKKRPDNPILASDWNLLIDAIAARTPRPGVGMDLVFTSSGFFYRTRRGAGGGDLTAEGEPFAEIITYTKDDEEKTGIRGGAVYAGNKVFNVDNQDLNLESDGTFKVWIKVDVTAKMQDEVLMPGIEDAQEPTWQQISDGSYPDQTTPEVSSATGTAIIAVGILTIEDGVATLVPAGYGSIQIDHCPGLGLSHTRV